MYTIGKILIVGLSILSFLLHPQHEIFITPEVKATEIAVPKPQPISIKSKFETMFGKDAKVMYAVAQAESELKPDNKGYNCMYGAVSKPCKKEDRGNAWSVDCGILQVNTIGKSCPPELLDIDGNIKAAHEIYLSQGMTAWVEYTNKHYIKYLNVQ